MTEISKSQPAADYPPEEGCYLRGNDYSPVAVVVSTNSRLAIAVAARCIMTWSRAVWWARWRWSGARRSGIRNWAKASVTAIWYWVAS